MTRDEYLSILEKALRSMNESDRLDAVEYYREYFDEAGPENESRVIGELGPPKKLAAQIRAQCAVKEAEQNPKSGRKGVRAVWLVSMSIFAVPIALPLAIAAALVVLALLIALIAALVSFFAAAVACLLTGALCLLASLLALFQNPPAGLTMLGLSMAALGVGGLIFIPTMIFSRWCFRRLAQSVHAFATRKAYS